MKSPLADCDTVIFDCDGVILQSNHLKSGSFGAVLEGHDPELVAEFVAWHKRTGGVSRFEKFVIFFRDMLGVDDWPLQTDAACKAFGLRVSEGLLHCPYVPGFEGLLAVLTAADIPLAVNTGGAEDEVREIFRKRGLADSFQIILGSPTTKRDNMIMLREQGLIGKNSVYLRDSSLDLDLAKEFSMRFVFVAHESEWPQGAEATRASAGTVIADHTDLLG